MKNRKGAAFLIVVVLSAFILLLVGLLAILGESDYKNQAQNLIVNKALAIAEKGIATLTNPSTPYTYDSFVVPEGIVTRIDSQSFCWTKAVFAGYFFVDGFPDPKNPPDPENYVIYDIFKVYSVGVVTNVPVTDLTAVGATALLMGNSAISSARAIALTVVEKEAVNPVNNSVTLTFVPNNADPPEISTNYLPRKADWQETKLDVFLNAGYGE